MPTAASWTERAGGPARDLVVRPVEDLVHLLRFRTASVRRPRRLLAGAAALVVVTIAVATLPALAGDAAHQRGHTLEALILMPTALAGFVLVAAASAMASGGGRELVAQQPAAVLPISPTTDHLGALLLAPLNVAWLIQAWLLLGLAAYAVPPAQLPAVQLGVVVWLALGTALGQLVAWTVEAVRRTRHGTVAVRTVLVILAGGAAALQVTGHVAHVLDRLQTRWVVVGLLDGFGWPWAARIAVELGLLVTAVVLGALPAWSASRRAPHDAAQVESGAYAARRLPRTAWGALVRTDRGSVWRAVPMRRGLGVLAVGPGVVALGGGLTWDQVVILPGLVASGGALLFGVNAWCLDGRGGLWRESLPVSPGTVFAARAWVLTEFLLAASAVTVALAALRAGVPSGAELTALLCGWTVVVAQVVSGSMRWSATRPFAVDLRSARDTPAPPLVMVGYSTRLAVTTTLTGVLFSGLAHQPHPLLPVLLAVLFLAWSSVRLRAARDTWTDPVARARVITTVAG